MRCSSQTSTVTPGRPAACSCAASAKRVGVKRAGRLVDQVAGQAHGVGDGDARAWSPRPARRVEAGPGHHEPLDPAAVVVALVRDEPVGAEHRSFDHSLHGCPRARVRVAVGHRRRAGRGRAAPDLPPARTSGGGGAP